MKSPQPLIRATANRIARLAQTLFPHHRSDWAKALANELQHVPSDMDALRWATGALFTAICERMRIMKSGTLHVPRWLLSIEMLVCFVPLTLLGVAIVASAAKSVMTIRDAFLYLSVAAVGPIGLVVALRKILRYGTVLGKGMVLVLCLAAGWTLLAYTIQVVIDHAPVANWWREFVLIALLPAIGVGHLLVANRSAGHSSLG